MVWIFVVVYNEMRTQTLSKVDEVGVIADTEEGSVKRGGLSEFIDFIQERIN